jgi:hypothetical protein
VTLPLPRLFVCTRLSSPPIGQSRLQEYPVQPTQVEQLLDMAAVHAFYNGLLEEVLGHPVPTPHDMTDRSEGAVEKSIHDL